MNGSQCVYTSPFGFVRQLGESLLVLLIATGTAKADCPKRPVAGRYSATKRFLTVLQSACRLCRSYENLWNESSGQG
jgi:hypothetical protein